MPNTTATARVEPSLSGRDNPYLVGSDLEILHILHAIMREAALITVSLDVNDFFLTSLLAIDEDNDCMYLERARGRPELAKVVKNRRLSYGTSLDKVQIRFVCDGIEPALCNGIEAYRVPLPRELSRIQRREYYRVPTPIATPVKCRMSLDENAKDAAVELNICDISCGGIAVQSAPTLFTPEVGARYACTIFLPGTSGLRVSVQARNRFTNTLRNGTVTQRCGFTFLNPPENVLASIQRYIMTLERQRRSLTRRGD